MLFPDTTLFVVVVCAALLVSPSVAILDKAPLLECFDDGMRLHFTPTMGVNGTRPLAFMGHVYVRSFFYTNRCHLDYTRMPVVSPFYLHIPYSADCQIHRERLSAPPGISFSTTVIVQHHRLLMTATDKAYSVSCFYRDAFTPTRLDQSVQVGDLTTQTIISEDPLQQTPSCTYQVLQGNVDGPTAKYANIGDILVHKFACESSDIGMLVHTCFVRDGIGNEFCLVDERGCPTDLALVGPLDYASNLTSASTAISAFKFADQMIVYFTCHITVCRKANNGCEGISPPVCQFIPLPTESGPTLNVIDATTATSFVNEQIASTADAGVGVESSTQTYTSAWIEQPGASPVPTQSGSFSTASSDWSSDSGAQEVTQNPFAPPSPETYSIGMYNTPCVPPTASTGQPTPQPLANVFDRGIAASRHSRSISSHPDNSTRTLSVATDQVIVFSNDADQPAGLKAPSVGAAAASASSAEPGPVCPKRGGSAATIFWALMFTATATGAIVLLFLQRRHYGTRLKRIASSGFGNPFELISIHK